MFLTGARLNNLTSDNIMGLKILKLKYSSGRSFGKINWKPLSLKMSNTLRVRTSGSVFCRNVQRTKGCRFLRIAEVIVCTFSTFFSVCSISILATNMLSMYAKHFSHVLSI